jgi:hypothetical protein
MVSLSPDASRSLPDFTELDLQGKVLPEGVGPGDIKAFQVLYREHCEVGRAGGWAGGRAGGSATGEGGPHCPLLSVLPS